MSKLDYTISGSKIITLIIDSCVHTINLDHMNHDKIHSLLIKHQQTNRPLNKKLLLMLADIPRFLEKVTIGRVEIINDSIYYDGKLTHNVVADRIIELYKNKVRIDYMVKFMERVYANPSSRAIDELWPFLQNKGLPLTTNGCFLAYKYVLDNYLDTYSETVSNRIGTTNEMGRELCDGDWGVECSQGFHIGALEYIYNTYSSDLYKNLGRVVICMVDPADVVSVPSNERYKLRTCKYKVVADWPYKCDEYMDASKIYNPAIDFANHNYELVGRERLLLRNNVKLK